MHKLSGSGCVFLIVVRLKYKLIKKQYVGYTIKFMEFQASDPHPNPLPEGEGVAIPFPSGRGLGCAPVTSIWFWRGVSLRRARFSQPPLPSVADVTKMAAFSNLWKKSGLSKETFEAYTGKHMGRRGARTPW